MIEIKSGVEFAAELYLLWMKVKSYLLWIVGGIE